MRKLTVAVLAVIGCLSFTGCEVPPTRPLGFFDYGWNSHFEQDSCVYFEERFGGCGWMFKDGQDTTADFSEYDHVVVVMDNVEPTVTKISINVKYGGTDKTSWYLSPVVNGKAMLSVDLLPEWKDKVEAIQIMGNHPGKAHLAEAELRMPVKYKDPVKLTTTNGLIEAKQFKGFSDDARVDFKYKVIGQDMNFIDEDGNEVSVLNWSIGIICSYGDIMGAELPPRYISLTELGEQTYSCKLGDIRYMLSQKDDDGKCGIYWNVWCVGNITEARIVSVSISELKPEIKN